MLRLAFEKFRGHGISLSGSIETAVSGLLSGMKIMLIVPSVRNAPKLNLCDAENVRSISVIVSASLVDFEQNKCLKLRDFHLIANLWRRFVARDDVSVQIFIFIRICVFLRPTDTGVKLAARTSNLSRTSARRSASAVACDDRATSRFRVIYSFAADSACH